MVYYGPWQEGRIHEEILYARTQSEFDDSHVELLGESPTMGSGWLINGGSYGWDVIGEAQDSVPGGISEPPAENPPLSEDAFEAALVTPVSDGLGLQHKISRNGTRTKISGVNEWLRAYSWTFRGVQYRMGYVDTGFASDANMAVPPGMDPSTPEYTTQLEPHVTGEEVHMTLLSAEVLAMPAAASYDLFYKDAGVTTGFLRLGPASIYESKTNAAPGPLNVEQMQSLSNIIDNDGALPGVSASYQDPRMPNLSILYVGAVRNDAAFESQDVESFDGGRVAVRIRYQAPRWRQVFFTDPPILDVPYRRTYPRDDALAGGAGRNWPRPKSIQSSNRTSGGYL